MPSDDPRAVVKVGAAKPICQENLARMVATTKGEQSVAALALREFHRRRLAGEDVIVFPLRGRWIVATEAGVVAEMGAAAKKTRTDLLPRRVR